MSAWMSEKPIARSGASATISSTLALVNAETFGFSRRACGGRTVKPEMPTMRRSSPSAYSTSVGSSVRQTMRSGYKAIGSGVARAVPLVLGAARLAVEHARHHEQQVGQPVEVLAHRVAHRLAFGQIDHGA